MIWLLYGLAVAVMCLLIVSCRAAVDVTKLRRDLNRLDKQIYDLATQRMRIDAMQRMHWHLMLALVEAVKMTPSDAIARGIQIEGHNEREFEANRKASLQ